MLAALVALAVLASASASVWAFQVRVDHPRDPAAFVRDARYYLTEWENDPHDPRYIADDALLAEGDRACEWLAEQPVALWRDSRRFQDMAVNPGTGTKWRR